MGGRILALVVIAVTEVGVPYQEGSAPGEAQLAAEMIVEPEVVEAGMFFDGATVRVQAVVPEGMAVSVSCLGAEEPVLLNRKGKALGLIWMNMGEVEIEGAPDVYLLHTSGPLAELANPSVLEVAGVGYDALEARITVISEAEEDESLFGEFVGLKESDGLYGVSEGAVTVQAAGDGTVQVSAELRLPPKAPPGPYRILLHGFAGGAATLLATAEVPVRQAGMAAVIRTLADDHALAYGVIAVVVAIGVGLLTGVLFGMGSKAH
jgi:hypothetical protein